jgi:LETM1 and EF-hand domain-containing protein 1, mitochondrial
LQEEDTKKLLKLKMELARFLQQTVGEVARDVRRTRSGTVAADAKALYSFLKDVRVGKSMSNLDIIQFASLFNDEITLDNLDRVHLVTLCQVRICPPQGPIYSLP